MKTFTAYKGRMGPTLPATDKAATSPERVNDVATSLPLVNKIKAGQRWWW
jgi:hypothetical protein